MNMLRHRGSKVEKIKQLDFFPKVQESFKQKSSVGGTFSVITFILILWLIYTETSYYMNSKFMFKFSPDTDINAKLKINIDMTVAMPCSSIGADILDSTNQNAFKFGSLEEEDTWFELSPNQRRQFDNEQHFNSYLREEYHAVKDVLWKSRYMSNSGSLPPREDKPNRPHDACRIYGSLILNKVSGNFHITAGKSLNLPRGHIHISAFISERDYNFTHRINRFSFGDSSPGIVHPLEGDETIAKDSMTLYQYFIEVVPTSVKTFLTSTETCQYSVKELSRPINHDKGSHGMPGIFFKYDVSALKVHVIQEREHVGMFLAKLCSMIGGIYVCSGIINSVIQLMGNFFLCKWMKKNENVATLEKYKIIVDEKVKNNIPDVVPLVT
ncbi:endoplasmic reticulum-Golgi intermediate compartment protein 2 [Onthophagus taurus]|uniref:endoplasmic reticulum-Golgi intermediate compartment protein 2 n=1 Tax=Onthophagus taurus TaxID=166361 RepID=UPI000C1FFB0C|nr:endoplasmic reticulum-Golgi intermediate compartment protein 2 [Onthophagus taurus]